MNTESARFKRFFNTFGIPFNENTRPDFIGIPGVRHIITVSQAHFLFDKNGNYMGIFSDDTQGN